MSTLFGILSLGVPFAAVTSVLPLYRHKRE